MNQYLWFHHLSWCNYLMPLKVYKSSLSWRNITEYISITIVFTAFALLALTRAVIPVVILCKVRLSLKRLLSTRKVTGFSLYSSWCWRSVLLSHLYFIQRMCIIEIVDFKAYMTWHQPHKLLDLISPFLLLNLQWTSLRISSMDKSSKSQVQKWLLRCMTWYP